MIQMTKQTVRIGCAGAGYGDGLMAGLQLLRGGDLDYVMYDYLSEMYMPMAGRMRLQDPKGGFAADWVDGQFASILPDLMERKVKLIANAGAVNPRACVEAMQAVAARMGYAPKIALVGGDDLITRAGELRAGGYLKQTPPDNVPYTTLNAYIGAFPIAKALAMGADIVLTGRVVDSALVLGPLIHEFGWMPDDYDRLSAGSLIGHLLECGAQATGGLFTDWHELGDDFSNIGYPIAVCSADGSAIVTKPPGTQGLVSVGTVAEQLLYEIGDPRAYRLPDVACDFSDVSFEQVGPDQVRVTNAKGYSPGADYKAIATWDDGWRSGWGFFVRGPAAAQKARVSADSVLKRVASMLRERNMPQIRQSRIEVIGDDESYGAQARPSKAREILCRMMLETDTPAEFAFAIREFGTAAVSMTPGIAGSALISPPTPVSRQEAFLYPADKVKVTVTLGDQVETVTRFAHAPYAAPKTAAPVPPKPERPADSSCRLEELAWARSGDKGNICNIGVIARKPEYLPYIAAALNESSVAKIYAHMFENGEGSVRGFYLPGCNALNFMLDESLDGGCGISLRFDPFGKGAAQDALDVEIPIPAALRPARS